MLTAVLAIWAAFGFECALIAYIRGRNPLAWFALGEMFGPFALVTVFSLGMVEKAGVTRKCRFCKQIIRAKAVSCKHCGRAQRAVPAPGKAPKGGTPPAAPPAPAARTWKKSPDRSCLKCRHYQLFKCRKDGLDLRKIEITKVGCTLFNT